MTALRIVFLLMIIAACHSNANTYEEVVYDMDDFQQIPDKFAQYPDGVNGIKNHIVRNLKYPKIAYEKGIEGRVVVSYIVNIHGKVEKVRVVNSVDRKLDKEAVRVIEIMGKWKPAYLNGKAVSVEYKQPFMFKIL